MKARTQPPGTLIAVDGVSGAALARVAKRLAADDSFSRLGISRWDASGLFGDLDAGGAEVERPSARTLLLLYAADLVFRIRWEIGPALDEGRTVVAAPYVDTAVALGRAAGVDEAWLRSMFEFAPAPAERRHLKDPPPARPSGPGFVEFVCRRMAGMETRSARESLLTRAHARLRAARSRG